MGLVERERDQNGDYEFNFICERCGRSAGHIIIEDACVSNSFSTNFDLEFKCPYCDSMETFVSEEIIND
jgi:Zn finger protein HypA/HybF involved in hydrogenase expression